MDRMWRPPTQGVVYFGRISQFILCPEDVSLLPTPHRWFLSHLDDFFWLWRSQSLLGLARVSPVTISGGRFPWPRALGPLKTVIPSLGNTPSFSRLVPWGPPRVGVD